MSDLFGGPEPPLAPRVVALTPAVTALSALALACAHSHALSYPHRRAPHEEWLQRYAETQGLSEARQLHQALHRLPREQRAAIAEDLTADA